jgi:hypothetical protein
MEDNQGVLWYNGRVCVPNIKELKDKIFLEAHKSAYSIHLGRNKMYHDLKATYWWYGMKKYVAEYVALCNTYQSESQTSMTRWDVATFVSTRAEVGRILVVWISS